MLNLSCHVTPNRYYLYQILFHTSIGYNKRMKIKLRIAISAMAVLGCAGATSVVLAQGLAVGQTAVQFNVLGLNQFSTGMSGGGSFDWSDAGGRLGVLYQATPTLAAGASLGYSHQNWNWSNPAAFGNRAPWGGINTTRLGLSLTYAPTRDWRFMIAPTVEWAGEDGAGTSNSTLYGGVLSATKVFSPSFTLGLGAGVFREMDQTRAFPFLVINWKINDRLTLKNPLPAGPAGGAGLELEYRADDNWTFGVGGAWRNYRFRLNNSGPFAGGIGQNRMIPVFARVSYAFTPKTSLDLYAFASFAGNVQAQSADKLTTLNTGYNTGVGLGLNLSHRF